MTDFYNYSNFNENDELDKLDKLAREINDKKNKDKLKLIREVDTDFKKTERKWEKQLDEALIKNNNYMAKNMTDDLQGNDLSYNNLYSDYALNKNNKFTYSEASTDNSLSLSNKSYSTKSLKSNKSDRHLDISTLSTEKSLKTDTYQNSFFNSSKNSSKNSSYIDSISIDSYIDDIQNNKNTNSHYKLSKIIKSLDFDICSKNDDNIYDHVKKCNNCKKKLMHFLNNDLNINTKNKNIHNINFLNKKNIQEIVIMIMVGIFLMILMDLVCNRKK
jgi:hypothetical protein